MDKKLIFGHALPAVQRWVFGAAQIRQQNILGMREPQSEVNVVLCSRSESLDVTGNNVMACAQPLTVGVGFTESSQPSAERQWKSLEFRAGNRLLAEIAVRSKEVLAIGRERFCLFEIRSCRNYCLPKPQLWANYARAAYRRRQSQLPPNKSKIRISARKLHCVFAFYTCPRPVFLVSVSDGSVTNLIPMDLVSPIGQESFALALHSGSTALELMERSRRIALSSVPLAEATVVFEMGRHHNIPSVDVERLPFPLRRSVNFGLPVPEFSLRVREMEIHTIQRLGSHTVFVARIVEDQFCGDGLQVFQIHGFYHVWRQQALRSASMAAAHLSVR